MTCSARWRVEPVCFLFTNIIIIVFIIISLSMALNDIDLDNKDRTLINRLSKYLSPLNSCLDFSK